MIVDVHAHLGIDYVFDVVFTREELLESQQQNGVDATIVQPGTTWTLAQAREQHDAIAALARDFPGRFFGMANPNPHLDDAAYRAELERCVRDLGFVAVKMHPLAHAVNPNGSAGRRIMTAARDLRIPVMVHTGNGAPFALPSQLIPLARLFPTVNLVVAHSGDNIYASEAAVLADVRTNTYLETTWSKGFQIKSWVRQFGANRVMFGSDHADNCATELTKHRTIGLTDEELRAVLGETAQTVFRLP